MFYKPDNEWVDLERAASGLLQQSKTSSVILENPYHPNNANWLLTGEGEMLFNNNEVREPDERKGSTSDLRKRIELVEVFLKGKFKDFE